MNSKGATFERKFCRLLSSWWGDSDDIFWRTAGSGAMAKTRSKKSKTTFGQYGDIQAVDPLGQPLMNLMVIELKRGYKKWSPFDSVDKLNTTKQPFELFLDQVLQDRKNAGTPYWMLVTQRDRRGIIVFVPHTLSKRLKLKQGALYNIPGYELIHGMRLEAFLTASKQTLIEIGQELCTFNK